MENGTYRNQILMIEGLKVTPLSSYPAFIFLFLAYIFILVSNIGLIVLILMDKTLHKPMYLLFCNLSICDALGATVVVPGMLKDIFKQASDRYISYIACVIQAYLVHVLGTSNQTILMAMAFDRYVAICNPLRYNSIMTNKSVVSLTAFAWGVAIILSGILISLSVKLSHCSSTISYPYCDNPSLFKLSCENVIINQIYGLCITSMFWIVSISCIAFTYIKIAILCLSSDNSGLKSKAMKTCTTHLCVYFIVLACAFTLIVLHRFTAFSDLGKLASVLYYVIPSSLNPIIYGVQTKEIRQGLWRIFH
ncbi:olfactory receptor 52N2-like [Hoplias malabaricus]|uniref:olfactory receptor 52N2-like n=1 Tax=Hoplias malabaricus TaxID=27720 RepID=UPI003462D7A4